MATIKLHVVASELSDKSLTYAVVMHVSNGFVRFEAVSEDDAHDLANALAKALQRHTNEDVQ